MADNNDKDEPKDHEEEFGEEFNFESEQQEDLLADEHEAESETPIEVVPKQKSVMLPLLIGVAIVGFIGWKVFNMLTGTKTEVKGPPKETPTQSVSIATKIEPAPAPITQELPKTAIPDVAQAQEQAKFASSEEKISSALQKRMDQQLLVQKQQFEAMQKELSVATQNLAAAHNVITNLQHDLSTLSATVHDLNTQIHIIRQDQVNLLAKQAEKAKKPAKPKTLSNKSEGFTSPSYHVHAIIPGRAWVRTREGKTITVTEGDPIGEYGKVLKIDAPNGIVITTSGVTLR